jgi:hypothetical protein
MIRCPRLTAVSDGYPRRRLLEGSKAERLQVVEVFQIVIRVVVIKITSLHYSHLQF